jgi:hypothetical protein
MKTVRSSMPLRRGFEDLRPQGELEEFICQRVVNTTWRLIRAARIETGLFASVLAEERTQLARDEAERFLTEPIRRELEKRMLKGDEDGEHRGLSGGPNCS